MKKYQIKLDDKIEPTIRKYSNHDKEIAKLKKDLMSDHLDENKKYKKKAKLWKLENEKIDKKLVLKAKVILAKSENKKIETIMEETGLSKRTIISYTRQYIENKYKFLYGRPKYVKSELYNYRKELIHEFYERPPLTYKEAAIRIEKLTGLKRSKTQVRSFLQKEGLYSARCTDKINNLDYDNRRKLNTRIRKYKEQLESEKRN